MRERDFESQHAPLWHRFEQQVAGGDARKAVLDEQFPQLYRQLCHHLAMARQRDYSEALVNRLNRLVMAGHHQLYRREQRLGLEMVARALAQFVITLRHARVYLICAVLLFLLPALVVGSATYFDHSVAYSLMSPAQVADIESMYDPDNRRIGPERDAETDLVMFGYYIKHNIGIAFRAFAGGIFLGIGSVWVLLFNGVFLGAVAGYLTQAGFSETFYPFVIGHGAFELTAIVISGAAGMMVGYALINPGRFRRVEALRLAAAKAVRLMYGAMFMLLVAAFLEAFWSSSTQLPVVLKLSVGAGFWLLVLWFCFFSSIGQRRESY
ncbi:hypothetical protein BFW38_02010 [Terasakiispira papahanaumokuakeensis]|uniref:Stage II sporulation protein M n=1 Tax=Terasakiispira papahanaumokuakeensis TaxID=197479 RepID=A0A1E2V664_9GAMM|nr:stage II sporulation protein M [Terasakiispira papahanaumokuakeensis]ODC02500.1 hypothetical protein BFW38_02010 [Terasakiispira papahanaumokuakeensis]